MATSSCAASTWTPASSRSSWSGACVSCPASTVTLKAGIERILKDRVEGVTEVVNVGETLLDGTPVSL